MVEVELFQVGSLKCKVRRQAWAAGGADRVIALFRVFRVFRGWGPRQ
jgi:hypothetical protein